MEITKEAMDERRQKEMASIEEAAALVKSGRDYIKKIIEGQIELFADHRVDDVLTRNEEKGKIIARAAYYDEENARVVVRYEIRRICKDGSLHGIVNKINTYEMNGWG
ncbi:MAG: hypothetical protein ACXWYM_00175 [Candidatus Binatia bacterium]